MADKSLSPAAWTAFAKKRELDDASLVKALTRLEKAADGPAAPLFEAQDEVDAQLKKLQVALAKRKPDKAGEKDAKEIKDRLQDMADAVSEARKQARAQAEREAAAEEEADSPVLLSSKMLPLLRDLRKGEVTMHALVCTAGKNTAVLIMRRAIAPSRRKLLSEAVDAKAGAKFIAAECLLESKALTFVVQGAAAGLAKRLKQALLDQTGLRLKVRVRGEDGAEEDGKDEDEAGSEGVADQTEEPRPDGPGRDSRREGGTAASPQQRAYEQRQPALQQRLEAALRAQHPEATKLRAASGYALEKAEADDYAAALKALDMVEKLLGADPTQSQDGNAQAKYEAVLRRVTPALEAALKAQHPEATKLRALSGFASEKAAAGDFDAAIKALEMIEKLAPSSSTGTPAKPDDPAAQWKRRLAECMPAVKAALEARPGNLADISRLLSQAQAQSKPGGDLVQALDLLERAYVLALAVGGAGVQPQPDTGESGTVEVEAEGEDDRPSDAELAAQLLNEPGGSGPSMVALTKARLAWDSARKSVQTELMRLEQVILEAAESEPDFEQIRQGTANLYDMLYVLDESLIDILDDMLNASDPALRFRLRRDAAAKIDAYAAFVASDELVQSVDGNPFMPVKVRATLESTLANLRARLA